MIYVTIFFKILAIMNFKMGNLVIRLFLEFYEIVCLIIIRKFTCKIQHPLNHGLIYPPPKYFCTNLYECFPTN